MEDFITIVGLLYVVVFPIPTQMLVAGYSDRKNHCRWWATVVSTLLVSHVYHMIYFTSILADYNIVQGDYGNNYLLFVVTLAYIFMALQVVWNKTT